MKRTFPVLALLAVFTLPCLVLAGDDSKPKKKDADGPEVERMVAGLLLRFDKNKDGKISKDEAKGKLAENFDKLDLNKDGFLDKDELRQVARVMLAAKKKQDSDTKPMPDAVDPQEVEKIVKNLLDRFDANKDGKISKEEAKGPLAENFDKLDLNKDGFLDKDELRRVARLRLAAMAKTSDGKNGKPENKVTKPALPSVDFDALDKDADGRLSRAELKGTPYGDHFDEIDTNKDGKIDRKEFKAYLLKLAEKKDK